MQPLDAGGPLTVAALDGKQIDVGLLFTSDPSIVAKNFVLLDDDKHLQLADNIAPVVRNGVLQKDDGTLKRLLNSISAKLSQSELNDMNKQVAVDKKDSKEVAAAWLERRSPRRVRVGRRRRRAVRGPLVSERFDFIVIGAGASGEAAANHARARGASVALVERDLFGGTCAFWGCMPSKTLLHAAAVRACGGDYSWEKASARRDYMIVREGRDYPDDSGHIKGYESVGIVPVRGTARITAPGRVSVETKEGPRELEAKDVIVAVGSVPKGPKLEGLAETGFWTNREGTSLRTLPNSIAILGAGPSGTELAQVYARFDVRTVLVSPRQVNPTDHPKSSALLAKILRGDGVDVRENARAQRIRPRAGKGGAHVVELADGSAVEAEVIELNVGRSAAPALATLGLENAGVRYDGGDFLPVDDHLRAAEHLYGIGDCIGHELSTHLGHYEGETAVKIALGDDVRADFRATPRAVYP